MAEISEIVSYLFIFILLPLSDDDSRKIIISFNFFPFVPWLSRFFPGRDGTGCQNPGPARGKVSKPCPIPCPIPGFDWLSHPAAKFWACPIVPLSWDNEGISVPLSGKVALSRPVGNPSLEEYTLGKKASGFTRICTRVQSSEMTKFLDIFEDQKIDKMDIIFCHDPQIVKCSKWFLLFT